MGSGTVDDLLSAGASSRESLMASRIQNLLNDVDWYKYERRMVEALREASEKFRQLHGESVKVFQIAIWTDPGVLRSDISFETRDHALTQINEAAKFWRDQGREDVATRLLAQTLNDNGSDYLYPEFLMIDHPELAPILERGESVGIDRDDIQRRITESLDRVVDRAIKSGALESLPREDELWIGINSVRDWYDHVRRI